MVPRHRRHCPRTHPRGLGQLARQAHHRLHRANASQSRKRETRQWGDSESNASSPVQHTPSPRRPALLEPLLHATGCAAQSYTRSRRAATSLHRAPVLASPESPLPRASRAPPARHRLRRAIVHEEQACRNLTASSPGTRLELLAEWLALLPRRAAAHLRRCHRRTAMLRPSTSGTRLALYTPLLTGCAAQPCHQSDKRH